MEEKVDKCQDLTKEIRRLWEMSATVVTIVVGVLGAVSQLEEYMRMLDINKRKVDRVQLSTLFSSAKMLRKVVLDISVWGV